MNVVIPTELVRVMNDNWTAAAVVCYAEALSKNGELRSFSSLAKKCGVTSTTVWRHLKMASQLGLIHYDRRDDLSPLDYFYIDYEILSKLAQNER